LLSLEIPVQKYLSFFIKKKRKIFSHPYPDAAPPIQIFLTARGASPLSASSWRRLDI
jgi:hypothetical protein